eukprot:TRINITY_DN645_c0_g1_i1.p1 TRINITY_DN645_c0_g1~~TRINITY_DN645_c0_g1_i1.p1  ORF type:complete len:403 (+),score=157.04 TRINITY_DN645_c0_g1_i1:76-1284(+)
MAERDLDTPPPSTSKGGGGVESLMKAQAAISDFFTSTAKSTKDSIQGIKQKIEYAAKSHNVIDDFKHDEEVALNIAILRNIKEQFRRLNKSTDSILQHQKDFGADEFKYGNRMLKASAVMDTPKHQELLEVFGNSQVEMGKFRDAYVDEVAKDLQTPIKQFIHTNIKQAQQKKHEINKFSIIRDEVTRNYQKKQETEGRKDPEKRDEAGIRLAEQKMIDAQARYDLLANELSMLVLSLGLRKQHETPEQLMAVMNHQEAMLENCLRTLQDTKQKMQVIMDDIQAGNTGGTIPPDKIKPKFKSTGPSLQFQGEGGQYIDSKPTGIVTTTVVKKKRSPAYDSGAGVGTISPSSSSADVGTTTTTNTAVPYHFTFDELPPLPPKNNKSDNAEISIDEETVEVDLQ